MTTAQLCEAGHRSRSTGRRAGGAPRPQADRSPSSRRPVVGKTRRAAAAKQRSTADRASEAQEVGELSGCASDFVVGLIDDAVKSEDEDGYVDMDMEIDDMDTEEVAAPAPEAKAGVRGMVCETLLRGAQSGALFDLLRAVSRRNTQTNEDTKEYSMRSHVFSVLAGASESGQLDDALARIAEGRRAAQTKQDAEIDAADETPTSASARGSDSAEDEDLDEVVSLATDDEEDEEEQAAEGLLMIACTFARRAVQLGVACDMEEEDEEQVQASPGFQFMPSVGSWNLGRPTTGFLQQLRAQAAPASAAPKAVPFRHRPSVGTWHSAHVATASRQAALRPAPAPKSAVAEAVELPSRVAVATRFLPSVGGTVKPGSAWLDRLKQAALASAASAIPAVVELPSRVAAPMRFLPSVGSTLKPSSAWLQRLKQGAPSASVAASAAVPTRFLPSVGGTIAPRSAWLQRLRQAAPAAAVAPAAPVPTRFLPSVGGTVKPRSAWLQRLLQDARAGADAAAAPAVAEVERHELPSAAAVPTQLLPSVGGTAKPTSPWLHRLLQGARASAAAAEAAPQPRAVPLVPALLASTRAPLEAEPAPAAPRRHAARPRPTLDAPVVARPRRAPRGAEAAAPASPTSLGALRVSPKAAAAPAAASSPTKMRRSRTSASPAGALRPHLRDSLRVFRMDADDSDDEPARKIGSEPASAAPDAAKAKGLARKSSFAGLYDALDAEVHRMDADSDADAPMARPPLGPLRVAPAHVPAMRMDLEPTSPEVRRSATPSLAAASLVLRSSGALASGESKAARLLPRLANNNSASNWTVDGMTMQPSRSLRRWNQF